MATNKTVKGLATMSSASSIDNVQRFLDTHASMRGLDQAEIRALNYGAPNEAILTFQDLAGVLELARQAPTAKEHRVGGFVFNELLFIQIRGNIHAQLDVAIPDQDIYTMLSRFDPHLLGQIVADGFVGLASSTLLRAAAQRGMT